MELLDAIEKNAVMEEGLKGSMAGKQSELKELKDILNGVEERRSKISGEMAQQEQFLQRYIANAQLVARDVEKAKRGVLQMEKVVNDVIKLQDAQLVKRQDRLDAASVTVSRMVCLPLVNKSVCVSACLLAYLPACISVCQVSYLRNHIAFVKLFKSFYPHHATTSPIHMQFLTLTFISTVD